MLAKTTTITSPDPAIRLQLAREALELYRQWDAESLTHDAWPVVMGKLASSLELVLELRWRGFLFDERPPPSARLTFHNKPKC